MSATTPIPTHVPQDRAFYFDIYHDSRVTEDVQGSYANAVKNAPDIFYTPANGGHWIVRRLKDMREVLTDAEHFSSREATIPRVKNPPFIIPFNLDQPENIPYRSALLPWFSAKAIQSLEVKLHYWAKQFVEDVADKGECDFIADVSARFPVSVFMEFMEMPYERLQEFRSIVDDYFRCITSEDYERVTGKIRGIMSALIELRTSGPGKDLVTHLLAAQINGRPISKDEVLAMCHLLFLGGMDTVTNVLGFTYQYLAQDMPLQVRLRDDPASIPKFVDEAVRCFGTANSVRIVRRDCRRFDIDFREGDMVLSALPISGRDDRENKDPDRFDIDRQGNVRSNVTFSSGAHLCLGHILARAEIRVLTEEWVKRIPSFSAKSGVRHGFRIGLVHAIESLPLRWDVVRLPQE